MLICLFIGALAAFIVAAPAAEGLRDRFLRGAVLFGCVLFLGTELLGWFGLLRAGPVAVWWAAAGGIALFFVKRVPFRAGRRPDPISALAIAGVAVILVLTAVTAAFSPPNSADAMAYHMPRVLYWAEQQSVRFFPTPYLNQIMLQPLAEYAMLHLYLLAGGDRFVNFVQWFGWAGSIAAVSAIAKRFGADARGQAFAALFCASLPSGILASSGAKNDCFLSLWMAAAVYFALEFVASKRFIDAVFLGGAMGLSLLTKATAYLFLPWMLLAVSIGTLSTGAIGKVGRRFTIGAVLACVCAIAVNGPHYVRNYRLSGSVLGFDSAQGDGFFRWRNESFGWKQTISNMLRNTSEQLGMRSRQWNEGVYRAVLDVDRELGIDPNDPATTFRWSRYQAPQNANDEAAAPNPWHGLILLLASCAAIAGAIRGRDRRLAWYAAGLFCGFAAFCFYLKWQPFLTRLFVPLFVLGAPLVGTFASRGGSGWKGHAQTVVVAGLCLFLMDNARHPAIDNWVRPLRGPKSVFRVARDAQYFADMTQWDNAGAIRRSVDLLEGSGCGVVGMDISDFQLEYPLEALLRERRPSVTFVHTGVDNVSRRYAASDAGTPCAVVCFECAEDSRRMERYRSFGKTEMVEQTVVFLR